MAATSCRGSRVLHLVPAPDLGQVPGHVDAFAPHLDHPGVVEHPPWTCPSAGFFLETEGDHISEAACCTREKESSAYQHSIKYLKLSLQKMLAAGSSLSFGIGCLTI